MKATIRALFLFLVSTNICACSFFDFMGYEEDTGLLVIERPSGYPSAYFGMTMAATGTPGMDLVAIGAGTGMPTIFYQLAAEGDLVDIVDPWDDYLQDNLVQAVATNSGSDLAGLPAFESQGTIAAGCVAIGEPLDNAAAQATGSQSGVHIRCEQGAKSRSITRPAEFGSAPEFGRHLAAIRPGGTEPWLLAVSSYKNAMVFSAAPSAPGKHSDLITVSTEIIDLAAGRLDEGRFFLAIGTTGKPNRVLLFAPQTPGSAKLRQVGCLEREEEPGFGGVMATGDFDGLDADELVVSATLAENRRDAVYVYDVNKAIANFQADATCSGAGDELLATVLPGEGDLDVECQAPCHFGLALATGDISTDPASPGPELCIGAPNAAVDGQSEAGAVYVYLGQPLMQGTATVAGQVADSTPEKGHWFGGGLTVAPMAGRNELLVGATGKGHVFVAFCTGVGTDLTQGGDLPEDANGSIVSTRCRP